MSRSDRVHPGEPIRIMQAHVEGYLNRLRQLKPLPVPLPDLVESTLPDLGATSIEWGNLNMAINTDTVTMFQVEDTGEERAFWYAGHNKVWPRPLIGTDGFVISVENPFHSQLLKWWDDAYEVDEKIQLATGLAQKFIGVCKHPQWVEMHWPELARFVCSGANRIPSRMLAKVEKAPNDRLINQLTEQEKQGVIDMFATTSLLPVKEMQAWVGYPKGAGR